VANGPGGSLGQPGLGIQTGLANWPGARDWPLEPGRAGGELDYRERDFRIAGHCGGLLGKRSVVAVLIAGAAMGVIMACYAEVASQFSEAGGPYLYARTAFGRLTGILVGWMLYLAQDGGSGGECEFVCHLSGGILAGAKEPWPRFVDSDVAGGVTGADQRSGRAPGNGGQQCVHGGEILPLLMVVLAGAAVDDLPSGAVGRVGSASGECMDEGDGAADLRLRWI
jgi:hypothetical protein